MTVAAELRRQGLEGLDTGELVALQAGAPMPRQAVAYPRLVHERSADRAALAVSLELAKAAQEGRLAEALPSALKWLSELGSATGAPDLVIEDIATVAARVASMPPAKYLARPVWPQDAYGVLAAEKKAGKTWLALDFGVSVAGDRPWLGAYPIETPGPVLMFLGEGSQRKMVRRLDAVCEAKKVERDVLPIHLCHRAPALTSAGHLEQIRLELQHIHPVLVLIDPLYLSAAGAKSADLYAMGAVLARVQVICQEAGAALVLVTHFNKTGTGQGSSRMTGAASRVGPGARLHER